MKQLHNFLIEDLPEFDNHKLVTFVGDNKIGLKGFIVIHRGNSGKPAFGATRYWRYHSELEALRDALRLSKTMSYKAALAGLPYGGGKGVLMEALTRPNQKKALLRAYAERVNYLGGNFITGADVGINRREVRMMRQNSPYMVGLRYDPVGWTVLGLFYAIQVCLEETLGDEGIGGRRFALQGLGKIGMGLLRKLYLKKARMVVADIDRKKAERAKKMFPKIQVVKPDKIYQQRVDVLLPCALSGIIDSKSIGKMNCKIIVGGANNQLKDNEAGVILNKLGIVYAPDYVVNAGGLISVVDEFKNSRINRERVRKKVARIKKTLRTILRKSKKEKRAPNLIADEMAERILKKIN